jgi:uncharacterized peroxidase-related enzyme
MSALFPSLPESPHLVDVFRAFPEQTRPLFALHDLLLRGESPLTVADRELIAAFVSGLNACRFCFGAHKLYAIAFGVDPDLVDALLSDIDSAPVDDRLRPILRYVAKLKDMPPRLTAADAQAVYAAGWSERALFDAIQVAAVFHFMNRLVEGTGVQLDPAAGAPTASELAVRRTRGYVDLGRQLGVID